MAKQLVGPFERHVEKAIVGIAGIILIAVIAKYVVTAPNQLEVGGELVDPATVDKKVADKAKEVRDRIASHRPQEQTPELLYNQFEELLDPYQGNQLALGAPRGVVFGPAVPIIDPPEAIKGQKKLVDVVPFPKPVVVHGRSTFNLGDAGNPRPIVDNWVTVSAVFDRKRQVALQKRQYGATQGEVIFGPVELQRRARRDDGTWSDDDWEYVDVWPAATVPQPPSIPLIYEDDQIVVPRENLDDLTSFSDELAFEQLQVNFLRPLIPEVLNGTRWTFPGGLMTCRELVQQDNEFLNPGSAEEEFDDRYGCLEAVIDEEEEAQVTPQQLVALKFRDGEKLMEKAKRNWSTELAIAAYNTFADIVLNQSASASDKNRARKLMADCEQLMRDIERRRPEDVVVGGEDEPERELLPAQQVWVHDARHNSVESGKTYQYRIRLLLYNALAAEPAQFEDKEDATVIFVGGEWSEPSDPVVIEPDLLFFLGGCDERNKTVRIELYQWFDGVWVQTKSNFGVGDEVKYETRVEVPIPDSNDVDRPLVPFEAGVTVVDIDFDRSYRDRKTSGSGVTYGGSLTSTCSAVLAGTSGELEERFVPTDKAHPVRKSVAKRVWRSGRP